MRKSYASTYWQMNKGVMFHFRIVLAAAVVWAASISAQTTDPTIIHPSGWSGTYDPVFREFRAAMENPWDSIRKIDSPFLTSSIRIIEESDTTQTPYSETRMKSVVFIEESPEVTIELDAYRNFEFQWINEKVIHLFSFPGRCVTVDTIYDMDKREVIYSAAFNHCGV